MKEEILGERERAEEGERRCNDKERRSREEI